MAASSLTELPFEVGQSPFRVKGGAYRGHLDYVANHVPGGVKAMMDAFTDERLRTFFAQKFATGVSYDVVPLVMAGECCAVLCGMPFDEFVRVRTRHQAQQDASGVFRLFVSLLTARTLATYLPRIFTHYFNFGRAETQPLEGGLIQGCYRGVPMALAPWFRAVTEAYLQEILSRVIAEQPRVICDPPRPDTQETFGATVLLPFRVTLR